VLLDLLTPNSPAYREAQIASTFERYLSPLIQLSEASPVHPVVNKIVEMLMDLPIRRFPEDSRARIECLFAKWGKRLGERYTFAREILTVRQWLDPHYTKSTNVDLDQPAPPDFGLPQSERARYLEKVASLEPALSSRISSEPASVISSALQLPSSKLFWKQWRMQYPSILERFRRNAATEISNATIERHMSYLKRRLVFHRNRLDPISLWVELNSDLI
jgi:hypothetical protein